MMRHLMLPWLVALCALAYVWPRWFSDIGDPFEGTRPLLGWLIAATMFAIGSLLPRNEIKDLMTRWPAVFSGTALQYSCMPLLAYGVGHLFRLEADAMTGVILVGCVPGAMASNVVTLIARGNVSYSVSLTTSATLFSPLVVPFVLWLTLGTTRQLNPWEVSRDLLVQVVGPVLLGHLLCRRFQQFERLMRFAGPLMANATILWLIAVVVGLNRERLALTTLGVLGALLLVNLFGYLSGYVGGRLLKLPAGMRRALTLEVGMQNAGLGTVMALRLFPENPSIAIPTAAYTFGCMFTGTLLAQWWGRRSSEEAVVPIDREGLPEPVPTEL